MPVYVSFSAVVNQLSTENLLGFLAQQANNGIDEVHLAVSTPGGSVMNGLNAYNVMRAMPFKLTTYNVGNVNSIGNVLFLAGEERYACAVSSFMFHGVGIEVTAGTKFEEKMLRERLDSIMNDQQRIGEIIRSRTSIDAREVKRLFLQAATKDTTYALQKGIIHAVREFKVPTGSQLFQLVFKG